MGYKIDVNLIRRGYYPKGGGIADVTIHPNSSTSGLKISTMNAKPTIGGIVHLCNLSENIGNRIKKSALNKLKEYDVKIDIDAISNNRTSPGAGITLWTNEAPKLPKDRSVLQDIGR